MCGLNICTSGSDNSNISYVSLSFILYPPIYSIISHESKSMNFQLVFFIVLSFVSFCFVTINPFSYFTVYESLTIPIFLLLFIHIPSYYRISTSFVFFIFTIFGSVSFILASLIIISPNFILSLLLISLLSCSLWSWFLWSFNLVILIGFRYLAPSAPIIRSTGAAAGAGSTSAPLILGISRNPSIVNTLISWPSTASSLREASGSIGTASSLLLLYALSFVYSMNTFAVF